MDCVDWIRLAQDRDKWRALVNAGSVKYWEIIEWLHNCLPPSSA
jgi:hypothetical protein